MICLEVSRNNQRLCLAGLEGGMCSLDIGIGPPPLEPTSLWVSAVRGDEPIESVEWVREHIAVGDLISIRVVEANNPDLPHLSPPVSSGFAEACDLAGAQQQYEELTGRLTELEARWGERLRRSPDA